MDDKFELKGVAKNFPGKDEKGSYEVVLRKDFYVEFEDVREVDHKEFFGMAPNKDVGLKYAGVVHVTSVKVDKNGRPCEVFCDLVK